jgi:hypothetical protein
VAVLFAQQLAAPTLEKIKNSVRSMGGVLFVLPRALQMQTSKRHFATCMVVLLFALNCALQTVGS